MPARTGQVSCDIDPFLRRGRIFAIYQTLVSESQQRHDLGETGEEAHLPVCGVLLPPAAADTLAITSKVFTLDPSNFDSAIGWGQPGIARILRGLLSLT